MTPKGESMNKLRRILLPVFVLAFAFSNLPSRSVAQTGTELAVPGLRARVTVRRDDRGIPYIEAANDEDLYFAQGYVTASDRLWQMDLQRRSARGELSEIFGQATLAQDKLHRTFGFARILDDAAAKMPASFDLPDNAYTKGVNAYIDSLTDKTLPPEFRILAYKPRRWTAADSLAVAAIMAEFLSSSWQWDMMRASLAGLPKEKREALTPDKSPLDVLVVGKDSNAKAQAGSAGIILPLPLGEGWGEGLRRAKPSPLIPLPLGEGNQIMNSSLVAKASCLHCPPID